MKSLKLSDVSVTLFFFFASITVIATHCKIVFLTFFQRKTVEKVENSILFFILLDNLKLNEFLKFQRLTYTLNFFTTLNFTNVNQQLML
jgi:hypothetical protein